MVQQIETVIVGGGQAGLATSYYLSQHHREHIVLEQAQQAGSAWQQRWDSFTLVTPNWMLKMPGAEYNGNNRDGFFNENETIDYFENYVETFRLPVQYGVQVIAVEPIDKGYRVRTDSITYETIQCCYGNWPISAA